MSPYDPEQASELDRRYAEWMEKAKQHRDKVSKGLAKEEDAPAEPERASVFEADPTGNGGNGGDGNGGDAPGDHGEGPDDADDGRSRFIGEIPQRLAILKLGGSIITQKSTLGGIRYDVVKRIAKEIARAAQDTRIVIVHGGGSFGHPLARLYHIYGRGKRAPPQVTDGRWRREGASAIQRSMLRLNAYLIGALVDAGLPALSVPGGILAELHDGELHSFHPGSIERYLESGLLPVTFGDVAPDRRRGVAIVSGDTLMLALAKQLKPDVMVFATDQDGIHTADPAKHADAELLTDTGPEELRDLARSMVGKDRAGGDGDLKRDATGGMALKMMELADAAEHGVEGHVVNGLSSGRIEAALRGETTTGTTVRAAKVETKRFPHA